MVDERFDPMTQEHLEHSDNPDRHQFVGWTNALESSFPSVSECDNVVVRRYPFIFACTLFYQIEFGHPVARHGFSHFLVDEAENGGRRSNGIDPDKDACILLNASSFQNICRNGKFRLALFPGKGGLSSGFPIR